MGLGGRLDTFTKVTMSELGAEVGASGDVRPASPQAPEGAISQGHPAEGGKGGLSSVPLTWEPGSLHESEGKGDGWEGKAGERRQRR